MPIFDYKCEKCGHVKQDVFVRSWNEPVDCVRCACVMTKLCCVPQMHLIPIEGIHLKNVCPGGKTFHSKREMQKYAKKNNLELGALL